MMTRIIRVEAIGEDWKEVKEHASRITSIEWRSKWVGIFDILCFQSS